LLQIGLGQNIVSRFSLPYGGYRWVITFPEISSTSPNITIDSDFSDSRVQVSLSVLRGSTISYCLDTAFFTIENMETGVVAQKLSTSSTTYDIQSALLKIGLITNIKMYVIIIII
jgi:hypothetical protein